MSPEYHVYDRGEVNTTEFWEMQSGIPLFNVAGAVPPTSTRVGQQQQDVS